MGLFIPVVYVFTLLMSGARTPWTVAAGRIYLLWFYVFMAWVYTIILFAVPADQLSRC